MGSLRRFTNAPSPALVLAGWLMVPQRDHVRRGPRRRGTPPPLEASRPPVEPDPRPSRVEDVSANTAATEHSEPRITSTAAPRRSWRAPRGARRVRNYLSFAVMVLILVGWAVYLRPLSMGGDTTYVVIRGSSMLPTYESGDLVITRAASAYAIGDAVAYRVPAGDIGEGTIVIHRIIGGDGQAGFVIQGDNNSAPDPWTPREADIVGKAVLAAPAVGQLIAYVHQPVMLGGLAAALTVMWIVARPPRPKGTQPATGRAASGVGWRAASAPAGLLRGSLSRRRSA